MSHLLYWMCENECPLSKPYQRCYIHYTVFNILQMCACTTVWTVCWTISLYYPFYNLHAWEERTRGTAWVQLGTEAEFLGIIETVHSHLYYGFYSPRSPLLSKSGLKLFRNVNIVYENLKSENTQDFAQKPQRYCTFMNSASELSSQVWFEWWHVVEYKHYILAAGDKSTVYSSQLNSPLPEQPVQHSRIKLPLCSNHDPSFPVMLYWARRRRGPTL